MIPIRLLSLMLILWAIACSQAIQAQVPAPSAFRFREAARERGLDFLHVTGAYGDKYYPETIGSGVVLFDVEDDGDLDVYLLNSSAWPHRPDDPRGRCALFLNDGAANFERARASRGLDLEIYGMGGAAGDYDADGDLDLYITTFNDNLLLRNDDGTFVDVTSEAGVAGGTWQDDEGSPRPEWSTGVAWFDADGDRILDLFVANYIEWSRETDIYTSTDGFTKGYALPVFFDGLPNRLYRGRGDGSFDDVSEEAGVFDPTAKSLGVAVEDFNADGLPDLAVANDTTAQLLYLNRGGRFEDVALAAGVAYYEGGNFPVFAGMGIDIGALANDERLMLSFGNFTKQVTALFEFAPAVLPARNISGQWGIAEPTLPHTTFPVIFADFDNDGWLDMIQGNGHVQPNIHLAQAGITYRQPIQLFRNDEGARFVEVIAPPGDALAEPMVNRGMAVGDLDNDGDLDIVATESGGPARLLLNEAPFRANSLLLDLRAPAPNTRALGAVVHATVVIEGRPQRLRRMVRTGSSFLSHNDLRLHFGLRDAERVERLEIRWPDGLVETIEDVEAGAVLTIRQGEGIAGRREFGRPE